MCQTDLCASGLQRTRHVALEAVKRPPTSEKNPRYPSGHMGPLNTPDGLNEGPDDWDDRPTVLSTCLPRSAIHPDNSSQDTHLLGRTTSGSTKESPTCNRGRSRRCLRGPSPRTRSMYPSTAQSHTISTVHGRDGSAVRAFYGSSRGVSLHQATDNLGYWSISTTVVQSLYFSVHKGRFEKRKGRYIAEKIGKP